MQNFAPSFPKKFEIRRQPLQQFLGSLSKVGLAFHMKLQHEILLVQDVLAYRLNVAFEQCQFVVHADSMLKE